MLKLLKKAKKKRLLLNVNMPLLKQEKIKGFKITALGNRIYSDHLIEKKDPRGRKYYWIGGSQPKFKNARGTDFEAVTKGYVSITPINMDLTDYEMLRKMKGSKDVF